MRIITVYFLATVRFGHLFQQATYLHPAAGRAPIILNKYSRTTIIRIN
jgi:hypothetical protein